MRDDGTNLQYYRKDGKVTHGIKGLVDGEPITKEEAQMIVRQRRELQLQQSQSESQPDTRDARIAQLEADVSKLLSLLANGGQ